MFVPSKFVWLLLQLLFLLIIILPGCVAEVKQNVPTVGSSTTAVRIVYMDNGHPRIWREETEQSEPFHLPSSIDPSAGFVLSADGRFAAFSRKPDNMTRELWVYDRDQQVEKRLVSLATTNIMDQYPEATAVELGFQWIPDSYLLRYHLQPYLPDIGDVAHESLHLIDAESGQNKTFFEGETVHQVQPTPDRQWLVALMGNGIKMIDLETDQIKQFAVPSGDLADQEINFTPNGESILIFVPEGIALLHRHDLTYQVIPFDYQPIGDTHFSHYPPIHWLTDTTFFTILPEADRNGNLFATSPAFTIWEIDIQQKAVHQREAYSGIFNTIRVAPDAQYLLYLSRRGGDLMDLHIGHTLNDRTEIYDSGKLLFISGWNSAATHFVYFYQNEPEIRIGQLGHSPIVIPQPGIQNSAFFADDDSLLVTSCQVGEDEVCTLQHAALPQSQSLVMSTIVTATASTLQYQYFIARSSK